MTLTQLIKNKIKTQGDISFFDFMQLALYAPNLGYYNAGLTTFGPEGDFTTAPELTHLFGYTLANQCADILSSLSNPILFEFGAGSGRLCVDILTRLEQLNTLPFEYHILDVSRCMQLRQQQLIQKEIPHLANKIKWLHEWPSEAFNGVIIANEVLDAMPVNRFLKTQDNLYEVYVGIDKSDDFTEVIKPCINPSLIKHINNVLPFSDEPYQSEVNLWLDDWLKQCHAMLKSGAMFVFDYGFPQHEYYHSDRNKGTIMCHYQHRAHPNPLVYIGEQDITAHVNFSHVANAAFDIGFQISGYTNQASFLLGNGLLKLLSEVKDKSLTNTQQAVKTLLQPNEMGELFKVIALTKQLDLPLNGFQLHDKRASL